MTVNMERFQVGQTLEAIMQGLLDMSQEGVVLTRSDGRSQSPEKLLEKIERLVKMVRQETRGSLRVNLAKMDVIAIRLCGITNNENFRETLCHALENMSIHDGRIDVLIRDTRRVLAYKLD